MGATVFYNHTSELATVSNTFSVAGVATDPTAITLVVTDPDGVATSYTFAGGTVTRTSAGVYTKDVPCASTTPGVWQGVWVGTGTASDVQPVTWTVRPTDLQRDYCTTEELKSRLGIADTVDDFEISLAVSACSRWVDAYCDRGLCGAEGRFWRATETRTYEPTSLYRLPVDDLVSVTTLKTDASGDGAFETTWTSGDYQLLPVNASAAAEPRPYTDVKAVGSQTFPPPYSVLARADRVQIVGVFGWPQVPIAVKQACLVLAADALKLKDAPFGVAGYSDYGPIRIKNNPVAAGYLAPYRRTPFLVG